MLGGINNGQAAAEAGKNKSNVKAETIANKFEKALDLLNDLSQELRGETHTLTSKDVGQKEDATQNNSQKALIQDPKPGEQASSEAASMATYVDEDLKTKKKRKDKKIGEKLGELLELEEELSNVEFEDKEHQEILEKFFQNMSTIKNRREELNRLEMQEERLEEELKKQESDKEEKNRKSKNRG